MKRKHSCQLTATVLLTLAGCLSVQSQEATTQPARQNTSVARVAPHAFTLLLNGPNRIDVKSPGVHWRGHTYHLLHFGQVEFQLNQESRLTATLTGGINTFDDVTYDVHVAVLNAQGQLLGTAKTICPVARIWEGKTLTMARTLQFDFGISRDYAQACFFTVAINNLKVLTPDEWPK